MSVAPARSPSALHGSQTPARTQNKMACAALLAPAALGLSARGHHVVGAKSEVLRRVR